MPVGTKAILPPHLRKLLDTLPVNVTRKVGAAVITQHVFPIHYRSLERWQLPLRRVNGKAVVSTEALLAQAWAKFSAAPVLMSGQHAGVETAERVAAQ